jgi:hypothetical protein
MGAENALFPREFTGPIQLAAIDAQTSQLKTLAFAA